jgi:hypothetical protein
MKITCQICQKSVSSLLIDSKEAIKEIGTKAAKHFILRHSKETEERKQLLHQLMASIDGFLMMQDFDWEETIDNKSLEDAYDEMGKFIVESLFGGKEEEDIEDKEGDEPVEDIDLNWSDEDIINVVEGDVSEAHIPEPIAGSVKEAVSENE